MATTFFKPLSCFEPTFERFATVTEDSRLKIFDARTGNLKQQLAEKDHLSIQYTAIAWGAATFQGVDQAQRSKRAKKQLGGAVALGTSKGSIVVWDLLRGEVHKVLGGKDGHSGKVNDLVFTEGATFLYSCSDDLQVIKWNVENGEVVSKFKADSQPVSSLALSVDNSTLATGSAMIKLWDLASTKSQKKFTGHASAVTSLNFSANGKLLLSASSSERYTSVWDLEAEVSEGAAAVFTATSNPVHVEFSKTGKTKAQTVLALLRSGVVGIWEFDRKAKEAADGKAKSHQPDCVIRVKLGGKKQEQQQEGDEDAAKKQKKRKQKAGYVLFAQFSGKNEVLVAYGKSTKPTFARINLVDESTGQLRKKVTIYDESGDTGALITEESVKAKKPESHTSVLGPSQVNSLVRAGVAAESSGNKAEQQEAAKKGKGEEDKQRAADKPKDALTLQEQLDRMQLTAAAEEAAENGEKESDEAGEEKMEAEVDKVLEEEVKSLVRVWGGDDKKVSKLKAYQVAPKATSLASALGQAIHTKDRHLLESVLNISQEQIIFGTVKRLQQDYVLPFLQLVLTRFRGNPNRSVALLVWIRAVLVEHVAYLSTVPALLTTLSDLYSTVRTRLVNHKHYVKLAGRLELLDAQIRERNARLEASRRNVQVYREDYDEGEEEEEEAGVSLMEVMDIGDEQDVMEEDEDDEEEEIEDEDEELEVDGEDDDEDDGGEGLRRRRRQAHDEENGEELSEDEDEDEGAENGSGVDEDEDEEDEDN